MGRDTGWVDRHFPDEHTEAWAEWKRNEEDLDHMRAQLMERRAGEHRWWHDFAGGAR